MDIFCEQIVKKKKSTFEKLTVLLIWVAGWFVCMGLVFLGLTFASGRFFMPMLLLAGGVVFGVFKLSSRLNLEFEYSVTNGVLDIDKIINRSDRKRMISVEIKSFDRFEVYDDEKMLAEKDKFDLTVAAVADPQGEDEIYVAVFRHPVKGRVRVVFQPGKKVLDTVTNALPRNLQPRRFG
ncbi:MAG: hypothetical protein IKU10_05805 [Clostridia bacterium]|nr:hypothetical protein [Clostridia bacterium]